MRMTVNDILTSNDFSDSQKEYAKKYEGSYEKFVFEVDENFNIDCIKCEQCRHCVNCVNCRQCVDCINCKWCYACIKSKNCNNSENCNQCISCQKCFMCDYCVDCQKCFMCDYCKFCKRCKYCDTCVRCYRCKECTDGCELINNTKSNVPITIYLTRQEILNSDLFTKANQKYVESSVKTIFEVDEKLNIKKGVKENERNK